MLRRTDFGRRRKFPQEQDKAAQRSLMELTTPNSNLSDVYEGQGKNRYVNSLIFLKEFVKKEILTQFKKAYIHF